MFSSTYVVQLNILKAHPKITVKEEKRREKKGKEKKKESQVKSSQVKSSQI